ncbi:MAG: enoyl-CoA hydratase [Xenophilus sp.]
MSAELKSTTEGGTMVLTLSNPGQRNTLGPEIYAAGVEALEGAENSQEVRCVVITGEGDCFCAGGPLPRLATDRERDPQAQADSIDAMHGWIDAIRTFPKPVIAAVEGAAAGAGFALALACDFVVAARSAVFAASHGKVGLSPDGGLSWQLGRALPRQLASEWLMLGGRVDAERLHAFGLVNELADAGRALDAALALAARLADAAPNLLASIKELLAEAPAAGIESQMIREREHFMRNLHHPNAGIGIAAFLDKRTPRYR